MGCGPHNPHGLQLVVCRDRDLVYSDVTFEERHIGAPGFAHGGAVVAACDGLLGFTLWIAATPAVTRSPTVEYLLPVPLHQHHRVAAHIALRDGRALHVVGTGTGTGTGSDGVTHFTTCAVFITVSADHFAAHGDVSGFVGRLQRFAVTGQPSPESLGGTP